MKISVGTGKSVSERVVYLETNGKEAPSVLERMFLLRVLLLVDFYNFRKIIKRTGKFFLKIWTERMLQEKSIESTAIYTRLPEKQIPIAKVLDKRLEQLKKTADMDEVDFDSFRGKKQVEIKER